MRPKPCDARRTSGLQDPCLALEGEADADLGTTQHAGWSHSIRSRSVRFCCVQFGQPIFLGVGGLLSMCRAEGKARARGAETCPLVLVPALLPACPRPQGPHHPASLPCGSGSVQATRDPSRGWAGLRGGWGVHSLTPPQAHVSFAPAQASFSVQPSLCAGPDRGPLSFPFVPQCGQCVLVFLSSGYCTTLAAFLELGSPF